MPEIQSVVERYRALVNLEVAMYQLEEALNQTHHWAVEYVATALGGTRPTDLADLGSTVCAQLKSYALTDQEKQRLSGGLNENCARYCRQGWRDAVLLKAKPLATSPVVAAVGRSLYPSTWEAVYGAYANKPGRLDGFDLAGHLANEVEHKHLHLENIVREAMNPVSAYHQTLAALQTWQPGSVTRGEQSVEAWQRDLQNCIHKVLTQETLPRFLQQLDLSTRMTERLRSRTQPIELALQLVLDLDRVSREMQSVSKQISQAEQTIAGLRSALTVTQKEFWTEQKSTRELANTTAVKVEGDHERLDRVSERVDDQASRLSVLRKVTTRNLAIAVVVCLAVVGTAFFVWPGTDDGVDQQITVVEDRVDRQEQRYEALQDALRAFFDSYEPREEE